MKEPQPLPAALLVELAEVLGVDELPPEMRRNLALAFAYREKFLAESARTRPTTRKGRARRRLGTRKHGGNPHYGNGRWVLREALISNVDHFIGADALGDPAQHALAALFREADRRDGRDPSLDEGVYDFKAKRWNRWLDEADEN